MPLTKGRKTDIMITRNKQTNKKWFKVRLSDFVIHAASALFTDVHRSLWLKKYQTEMLASYRDRTKPVRAGYPNQLDVIPLKPGSAPRVLYRFLRDNWP